MEKELCEASIADLTKINSSINVEKFTVSLIIQTDNLHQINNNIVFIAYQARHVYTAWN